MADQEWIVGENQTVPASPVSPEPPEPAGPTGSVAGSGGDPDPAADADGDGADGALEVAVAQRDEFENDYYDELGVPADVPDKDITRAYRKLAKQYLPDANPGDAKAEDR